jgi:tetratricopeptide (TPR) repeat protein
VAQDYADFELRIFPGHEGRYRVEVTASPAGEAESELHLPLDEAERWRLASGVVDRAFLEGLGARLYGALFTPPVAERFAGSLGRLTAGQGLRVRLQVDAPDLADLPWELMYDAQQGVYPFLSPRTPLVRYIGLLPQPPPQAVEPPLRILAVLVSPNDQPALDLAQERKTLLEALHPLGRRARVTLLEGATPAQLAEALADGYHVLHFVGHGALNQEAGRGYLLFQDESGRSAPVDDETLAALLHGTPLRLVVLNACESARGLLGVAPALARVGLPAVVAMQLRIEDESAIRFSRQFYRSLAAGRSVESCITAGRRALVAHGPGLGSVAWGTPLLYLQVPDGRVLPLPPPLIDRLPPAWRVGAAALGGLLAVVLLAWLLINLPSLPFWPTPTASATLTPSPTPTITPTPLAFAPAAPDEMLFVVAEFYSSTAGVEPLNASLYFQRGLSVVQDELGPSVPLRVERWPFPLFAAEKAEAINRIYAARVTFWGDYDSHFISPRVTFGQRLRPGQPEPEGAVILQPPALDIMARAGQNKLRIADDLDSQAAFLGAYLVGCVLLEQEGNLEQALAAFQLAGEIWTKPDRLLEESRRPLTPIAGQTFDYLGYLHVVLGGNWTQGRADWDLALTLVPTDTYALYSRGWASLEQGDPDAARRDFEQALAADPTWPPPRHGLARALWVTGKCERWVGDGCRSVEPDCDAALEAFRAVTVAGPGGPLERDSYAHLGIYDLLCGDLAQAIAGLERARELGGLHPVLYTNLGWAYYLEERYQPAISVTLDGLSVLQTSTQVDEQERLAAEAQMRYNLGLYYLAQGNRAAAEEAYRAALAIPLAAEAARSARQVALADLDALAQRKPERGEDVAWARDLLQQP